MSVNPKFFGRSKEAVRIAYDEENAVQTLASSLLNVLPRFQRPIVIVCIGTDRSTGDSLGPFIGTLLKEKEAVPFSVYGTLDDPIHAVNLEEKLQAIEKEHFRPFIIGIDACLGRIKSVGHILVGEGPVKPGAGVHKELPQVGDAHITGIVNVSGFMEFFVLQNTRLNLIVKMSRTVVDGIFEAGLQYSRERELLPTISADRENSI